jgi:acetyl esterase/lipase
VAIDYRHAPKYRFPAQLEDVQAALSYIKTHAGDWEIDPERIALMGRSAGAHLAHISHQTVTVTVHSQEVLATFTIANNMIDRIK